LIVVVFVDDIIFGGSMNKMCQEFAVEMEKEFEMSMLGEFSFFLGLQISQSAKDKFILKTKYIKEMLNKFMMEDCTPIITPMCYSNFFSPHATFLNGLSISLCRLEVPCCTFQSQKNHIFPQIRPWNNNSNICKISIG
jgi:hypothetical protein